MSSNAFFQVPDPQNEPVLSYVPGSPEKVILKQRIQELQNQEIEILYTERKLIDL